MIRGVLFDFDGVLVPIDVELKRKLKEGIIEEYCARFPVTREQATAHVDQALSKSTYDDPYFKLQGAARELGLLSRDEINMLFGQISEGRKIVLENTLIDMLRYLKKRGLTLGVVTLSSKERIEDVLKHAGVKECFDFVESASNEFLEDPNSQWKKAAYKRFLDGYEFLASEVLCVGDAPSIDLRPAKSLGMRTALVIHDDNRELEQKSVADHVLYRDALPGTLPSLISYIDNLASTSIDQDSEHI